MTWRWLSRRIVTAIHLRQIQRHGGAHGTRDEGMLDSALARPQNLAAYGEPTVFELAASYAFGIARNHPFVDGNKRTAITATGLLLELRGRPLTASNLGIEAFTLRVTTAKPPLDAIADWLEAHSQGAT